MTLFSVVVWFLLSWMTSVLGEEQKPSEPLVVMHGHRRLVSNTKDGDKFRCTFKTEGTNHENFKEQFSNNQHGNVKHEFSEQGILSVELDQEGLEELIQTHDVADLEMDQRRYEIPMDRDNDEEQDGPGRLRLLRSLDMQQRHLEKLTGGLYGIATIQAPQVWDEFGLMGDGVRVCVIDSGSTPSHPDMEGAGDRFTGDDTILDAPLPDGTTKLLWSKDRDGHGTHVTGTIGALRNGVRVVGVAPQVSFHIIRVFANDGGDWVYDSDLIAAAQKCKNAGAHIINMSLGGPEESVFERQGFEILRREGVLVVSASGNGGDHTYTYPASYPFVLSVAATGLKNEHASFSQSNDLVDIAAPGVRIESTAPPNVYAIYSGTSMACPHVAGVAALLLSAYGDQPVTKGMIDTIVDVMLETALKPPGKFGDGETRNDKYGHGIVQAYDAMELLQQRLSGSALEPMEEARVSPSPAPRVQDRLGPTPEALMSMGAHVTPSPTPPSLKPHPGCAKYPGTMGFRLVVVTDEFGSEISFRLVGNTGGEVLNRAENTLGNNTLVHYDGCLRATECWTFTIHDSQGNGLSGDNAFVQIELDGVEVYRANDFGSSDTYSFGLCSSDMSTPAPTPPTQ